VLLRHTQATSAAQAKPAAQAPTEAVGADNAGHMVMLKPQSRKRQAEVSTVGEEAALDTQQAQEQQALAEGRVQEGQEEQDGELTLEQRVNALQLRGRPAGLQACSLLLLPARQASIVGSQTRTAVI